jgi:cytochrome b6-f complex iron-sulfur subunit
MLGAVMSLLAAPLLGPWDWLGIGVGAAVLALAAVLVAASARRPPPASGPSPAGPSPAGPSPAGPGRAGEGAAGEAAAGEAVVTRRTVVQRGALGFFAAALAGVVAASIDYVVRAGSRRGRTFALESPDDVRAQVRTTGRPYYEPVGGFYVMPYPAHDLAAARSHYGPAVLEGMEEGFVALDQTCPHLGCRVTWCPSSAWFECPCHGSRYNAVGEQRRGPAPRGLDRYRVSVVDGRLTVDTGDRYLGPPPGTDTTGQAPSGPHCF